MTLSGEQLTWQETKTGMQWVYKYEYPWQKSETGNYGKNYSAYGTYIT
jgi:hypothetical protein